MIYYEEHRDLLKHVHVLYLSSFLRVL